MAELLEADGNGGTSTETGTDAGPHAPVVGPGGFAQLAGLNYLTLSLSIDPGRPIVFIADVTTTYPMAGEAGPTTYAIQLIPLSAEDRSTPLDLELLFGPFDAELDTLSLGPFSIPAQANSLHTSYLEFGALALTIEDDPYPCGYATGDVEEPVAVDLTGSTFTFVPLGQQKQPPTLDCDGATADPLP